MPQGDWVRLHHDLRCVRNGHGPLGWTAALAIYGEHQYGYRLPSRLGVDVAQGEGRMYCRLCLSHALDAIRQNRLATPYEPVAITRGQVVSGVCPKCGGREVWYDPAPEIVREFVAPGNRYANDGQGWCIDLERLLGHWAQSEHGIHHGELIVRWWQVGALEWDTARLEMQERPLGCREISARMMQATGQKVSKDKVWRMLRIAHEPEKRGTFQRRWLNG